MTAKPLVNVHRRKQIACALCREWRSSSNPGAPVVATIANYGLCERHDASGTMRSCARSAMTRRQQKLPNRVPSTHARHRAAL